MAVSSDKTGELINERYELLEIIGRGGQGLVYRAYDRWVGRGVAVKVLGSSAAKEARASERMMREQQALSALKGTAAVEMFDICRGNDGELCLVMELLSGTDLEEHLYEIEDRGERLELFRVAEIFDPIAETLTVAHDAGIVHRDLKPANVYLLDGGGVRLLDFGLARLRSAAPLTAAGTVMGSPSYIAPEVWKGQPSLIDHRVDVYSLGVILFRVVAGQLPFQGESLHEKFLGSTRGARPSLHALRADLPRSVDDWVAMALAIDREERFRNVDAMWRAFLHTFDIQPPKRRESTSIWAAAKNAVQRLAKHSNSPAKRQAATTERPQELSFMSQALAQSVPPEAETRAPEPLVATAHGAARRPLREHTLELSDTDLEEAPPSVATRPLERTVELSSFDLLGAEDAPASPAPPDTTTSAEVVTEKKSKGQTPKANKRKKPKKRRRRKKKKKK